MHPTETEMQMDIARRSQLFHTNTMEGTDQAIVHFSFFGGSLQTAALTVVPMRTSAEPCWVISAPGA